MIIDEISAIKRLESPLNLINRLRQATNHKNDAMELFTGPIQKNKITNPFERKVQEPLAAPAAEFPEREETTLDTILKDSDSQIKLGLAHDKSLTLLSKAVDLLSAKLDDVSASKLPAAITAASKVVESIRKERFEASRINKDREVHYHFYTPERKKLADFEVIEVQ
jgi:hypothetical protein